MNYSCELKYNIEIAVAREPVPRLWSGIFQYYNISTVKLFHS